MSQEINSQPKNTPSITELGDLIEPTACPGELEDQLGLHDSAEFLWCGGELVPAGATQEHPNSCGGLSQE